MARKYNYIYKRLVQNENDMIGNIAYSLYKTDKIKFIENFKEKHGGIEPEEQDLFQFHDFTSSASSIERYKMQAILFLNTFLDDTLSAVTKQMESDFVNKHQDIIKDALGNLISEVKPKPFRYGVFQGVLSSFIFTLITCAFIFFFTIKDKTVTFKIGDNNHKIESTNNKIESTNVDSLNQKLSYTQERILQKMTKKKNL